MNRLCIQIVQEAESWLGTPYVWRAAIKGLGADCCTFAWHTLNRFYHMPPLPENYSASDYRDQWGEQPLRVMDHVADRVDRPLPGDYLAIKMGQAWAHSAIATAPGYMIHAYGRHGDGGVSQQPIAMFRRNEIAYFRMREAAERTEWLR